MDNATEFLEQTGINDYAIKLEESKQPPFSPIYSLSQVKLKTLKTYIKTNQINGFIWSYKSLIEAPILFDKKSNRSFYLCINYSGLNNIIIKN